MVPFNLFFLFICAFAFVTSLIDSVLVADVKIRNKLLSRPTNSFSGYNQQDIREIKRWVASLEQEQLSQKKKIAFPSAWNDIGGRWLLRFTNNANSFSEIRSNSFLKSVEQQIDPTQKLVKHVLSFENSIPFLGSSSSKIILNHSTHVTSNSSPAQLAIDLDSIELVLDVDEQNQDSYGNPTNDNKKKIILPKLPQLALIGIPSLFRRGYFETTFIDEEIRISRGQFDELRVFQRL